MWSMLNGAIPAGWVECDGTQNAPGPDLRDRFIVGRGAKTVDTTGGGSTHSHATHVPLTHVGASVADHPATATSAASSGSSMSGAVADTLTQAAHTHDTPVLTHTVTQANSHPPLTHASGNHEPWYYVLVYIQRLT